MAIKNNFRGLLLKNKTVALFLLLPLLISSADSDNKTPINDSSYVQTPVEPNVPPLEQLAEDQAQELCDLYLRNVQDCQQRIRQGRCSESAVRKNLPGVADPRYYCVHGQLYNFRQACEQLGIPNFLPKTQSCYGFIRLTEDKFGDIDGAVHNGRLLTPEKFTLELEKFLQKNNVNENTPDSVRQDVIRKFKQKNYCISDLHPGTILIVPRPNTTNDKHAIVYLGCGYIDKDNQFHQDDTGDYCYASFNITRNGRIFYSYSINTNTVYVLDIHVVAREMCYRKKLRNQEAQKLSSYVTGHLTVPYNYTAPSSCDNMPCYKYWSSCQGNIPYPLRTQQALQRSVSEQR